MKEINKKSDTLDEEGKLMSQERNLGKGKKWWKRHYARKTKKEK